MKLSDNARVVMERRICARDENGEITETPEEVIVRVAEHIAAADLNYTTDEEEVYRTYLKFLGLMDRLDFLPNSPTLVNAGRPLGQLSACFVLPVEDSIDGIFRSISDAAKIHKTGGGTGFSFSRLRPDGSFVKETSGVASGPVSFMRVFDAATAAIKQGGTRRGANMGILGIDHPDIRQFIHLKDDLSEMTNFNISVAVTDDFMKKLDEEDTETLTLWDEIIESAWKTGDPGVIFIDRINNGKANPIPDRGPIEATNPCGEQPLYPYDSCNLGSINLSNFVKDGKVDFGRLADVTHDCVHFLDNVIDMNKWPLPEIEEVSKSIRRIGLGVMGWADMLIKLGITYGSDESLTLATEVAECISTAADRASIVLGMKRGPFPDIERSIYAGTTYRNSTRTTIAPTGTISIIADCSGGIEPLFATEFVRSHYLDKNNPNTRTELIEIPTVLIGLRDTNGNYPESVITASQLGQNLHIAMQASWQKHTDNAVSKTINLPNSATIEDVHTAYMGAWLTGCKGITVYRDGARSNQVLTAKRENEVYDNNAVVGTGERGVTSGREEDSGDDIRAGKSLDVLVQKEEGLTRRKLGDVRNSVTKKFTVGTFEGYIITGLYEDGSPGEVFIIGNKVGSATRGYLDTIGSLISYCLQAGYTVDSLGTKFQGTRFEPSGFTGDGRIPVATSIVDYIFRYLEARFGTKGTEGTGGSDNLVGVVTESLPNRAKASPVPSGDMCPECDGAMFYAEGCSMCASCFYSKCG